MDGRSGDKMSQSYPVEFRMVASPGAEGDRVDPPAVRGVWRRLVLLKISKIREQSGDWDPAEERHVGNLLAEAQAIATTPGNLQTWWSGEQCDHAWRTVHEAEAHAIGALPQGQRAARVREIRLDAGGILAPEDPVLETHPTGDGRDTTDAGELVRRYRQAWDDRYVRSRNYRNRLIVMTVAATVFVAALVAAGGLGLFTIVPTGTEELRLQWPRWAPSWPAAWAQLAIGTIGAVGGLLAGARQVVSTGGIYNPFFLPLHSLFLKIQMGALCAIVGVLAVVGGIAPEITTSGWEDIAVLALIFGASQQLITQLIDRRVDALVSSEPRERGLKR